MTKNQLCLLGLVASLGTSLAAASGQLPAVWSPYLIVAGILGSVLTAWLAQAPQFMNHRPRRSKAQHIDPSKLGPAVVILALCLGASASCGGLKANLVAEHQAIDLLISGVDDCERILCFGTTDVALVLDRGHCSAGTVGLTDERHQAISRALVRAFDAQARVGPALKAFRADDPPPADLSTALAAAFEVAHLAEVIDPSPVVKAWIAQVARWRTALEAIDKAIRGAA